MDEVTISKSGKSSLPKSSQVFPSLPKSSQQSLNKYIFDYQQLASVYASKYMRSDLGFQKYSLKLQFWGKITKNFISKKSLPFRHKIFYIFKKIKEIK